MTDPIKYLRNYSLIIFPFLLLLLCTNMVFAQRSQSGEFQVIQLASDQVFLQASSTIAEDIQPIKGDTLYLYRQDDFIGILKVDGVNFPRILTRFLTEPFAITRGEIFLIKWSLHTNTDGQIESNETSIPDEDPAIRSILSKRKTPTPSTIKKEQMMVSGRVYSGVNLTRSSTYWSRVQNYHDVRWSSVPYSSLTLSAAHLPGNWNVNIQGRYSYRFQTNSSINHPSMFSIYNLNAEKTFDKMPLTLQIGRFYNRYESTYSYWDGLMLHLNKRNWGAGISTGLEPSRSNEGIQTDVPKTGAFIHYRLRSKNFRWYVKANAATVYPTSGNGWMYAGLDQRLDFGRISMSSDIRTDLDQPTATMKLSRVRLRVNYDVTDWLELNGSYYKRSPYLFYPEGSWFLDTRYRYSGGFGLRFGNWGVSNSIRINDRDASSSYSFNSRVNWFNSPVWELDWSAYGTYWSSDIGRNWNVGVYASRSLQGVNLSAGLGVYRTQLLDSDQYSGNLSLNASKRFSQSFNANVRLQTSYGELMNRNSISISLWKSF